MGNNIRQRKMIADYINTTPNGTSEAYALMGTGTKTLDEQPSAQTKSRKYVCDSSTTKSVSGYDLKLPFELDQIMEQAAIKYIVNIGENMLTGMDAETELVRVDLTNPVGEGAGVYKARQIGVAVEVASFNNDDGDLGASGNLLGNGEWVHGEFNVKTKTFTPDKDSEKGVASNEN